MQPIITVIVPTYNVENYIETCLVSLMHQTFKPIEILVIDDCSTDRSLSVVEKLSKQDKRIKIIHNKNQPRHCRNQKHCLITRQNALRFFFGFGWLGRWWFLWKTLHQPSKRKCRHCHFWRPNIIKAKSNIICLACRYLKSDTSKTSADIIFFRAFFCFLGKSGSGLAFRTLS